MMCVKSLGHPVLYTVTYSQLEADRVVFPTTFKAKTNCLLLLIKQESILDLVTTIVRLFSHLRLL